MRLFGTSGIRAIFDRDLVNLAFKVGLAVSLLTIMMLVSVGVILTRRRSVTLGIQGSGGPKQI